MNTRSSREPGRLAVLEVGRVEDGAAADPLEAGLHHLGLGGVEHERRVGLGGEAAGDLVHVDGAVAADVVDAHVEDVRAFLHLVGGHLRGACPSRRRACASRNAFEPLALVRSPIIRNDVSCSSGDEGVDRRGADGSCTGVRAAGVRFGTVSASELDVLGRGAAAAADDLHAELGDEAAPGTRPAARA